LVTSRTKRRLYRFIGVANIHCKGEPKESIEWTALTICAATTGIALVTVGAERNSELVAPANQKIYRPSTASQFVDVLVFKCFLIVRIQELSTELFGYFLGADVPVGSTGTEQMQGDIIAKYGARYDESDTL
jgi:hypothetical protein